MRILFHHRTRGKGAEGVHIRELVNAFRSLGHEVRVIAFPGADPTRPADSGAAPSGSSSRKGVVAAILRHMPEFVFEFLELGYNIVAHARIAACIRSYAPDLLYERYSLFMFAGTRIARSRRIPILHEVNDSAAVPRVRPLYFRKLASRIEKWIFSRTSGLIFVSSHFTALIKQEHGATAPSAVIPNAANLEVFDPSRHTGTQIRKKWGLEGKVVCGYVGSFAAWHGIDSFIKQIANRLSEQPDLVLLLIGDGACFDESRRFVEEHNLGSRIILPGFVGHDELPELIAAMDFSVLPCSNTYGSPMKIFELMAMGVGVVAPDLPPIAEVIDDNVTGWLFESSQPYLCVDRVLEIAHSGDAITKAGELARAYIVRERQWQHNAAAALALVDKNDDRDLATAKTGGRFESAR